MFKCFFVLMFGDSNSQGVHPRGDNLVFRTVPVPGGTVCPTPGQKSAAEILPTAMCGDEKAISLHFGTNDAGKCDPVEFKGHYRKLVRVAKSKGADVICSNIYHRADSSTLAECIKLNTHIDVLNEQIKSVASEEGARYLDNVRSVGSTATKPNIDILTTPRHGVRYLHLGPAARIDLGQRIAAKTTGGADHSAPNQNSVRHEPAMQPPPSRPQRAQHDAPPPMNMNLPPPPPYHNIHLHQRPKQATPAPPKPAPMINWNPRAPVGTYEYYQSYADYVYDLFRSYPPEPRTRARR